MPDKRTAEILASIHRYLFDETLGSVCIIVYFFFLSKSYVLALCSPIFLLLVVILKSTSHSVLSRLTFVEVTRLALSKVLGNRNREPMIHCSRESERETDGEWGVGQARNERDRELERERKKEERNTTNKILEQNR